MDSISTSTLLIVLVILILLSAFFSSSETGLMSINRYKLRHLAQTKHKAARRVEQLLARPDRLLGLILIGNNLVNILASAIATIVCIRLFGDLGVAIATFGLTLVVLVFGEVTPKTLAAMFPEKIAYPASWILKGLMVPLSPLVWLINGITSGLLKMLKINPNKDDSLNTEELRTIVNEAGNLIPQRHQEMLLSILDLDKMLVEDIMVPRSDIRYLDLALPLETNLQRLVEYRHSYFPVCDGNLSELVGIINVSKVLHAYIKGEPIDLAALTQEGSLLPETLNGVELLNHFRTHSEQMALVVDEYGELQGLVTQQDLLEALAGDFQQEDGEDNWAFRRADGSWLLDGLIPLPELKDCLELVRLPEEEKHHYHTLGGLIMLLLGRVPQTGDLVTLEQWQLEIVDMDGLRIDKVLAMPLTDQPS